MNWKSWLHSLAAAAIASFCTAVTAAIADPTNFNLTKPGVEHLASVGGVAATWAVLTLLKQSPLPSNQTTASSVTKESPK